MVDPFHVISLANRCLDAVRRRVQTEQTGHRGRRDDPLYRARRVLLRGEEKLDAEATERLWSLLELGRPRTPRWPSPIGSRSACATSTERAIPTRPARCSKSSRRHCLRRPCRPRSKGSDGPSRTWFDKIANYHLARVSNGPTEALNNLIKRIKRIGFGFRNFENYRIRALLYAGKPNWRVLGSIVVR